MSEEDSRRISAWSGILAFLLILLPGFAAPFPEEKFSAQEMKKFFIDNASVLKLTTFLSTLGVVFFILFACGLVMILRRLEPESSLLPLAAIVGGAGTPLFAVIASLVTNGPIYFDEATPPEIYRVFFDLPMFGGIGPFLALFIGPSALVIWRTGFVPRWMGAFGLVVTVLALISTAYLVVDTEVFGLIFGLFGSYILPFLWILAVSIGLLLRRGGQEHPGGADASAGTVSA